MGNFISLKTNMKYTLFIYGIIAIVGLSLVAWYTSDTQVTERKMSEYQEKIDLLSKQNESLSGSISDKLNQIESLKQMIETDKWFINENDSRIKKYDLCIKGKSMDCDNADGVALSLIPQAHATIDGESNADDVRENILAPMIPGEFNTGGYITTYYTNNPVGDQCKNFHNEPKRIVIHYTATPYDISVESIVASHHRKNGTLYYGWYHYLIKADGSIVNIRPENCNALAEPTANHDAIHISYIGDDKPTKAQEDSIIWLTKDLSSRLGINIRNVTSHADIAPKNHKESMKYMFGGYDEFQKKIRLTQKITRDGKTLDALTYAWHAWGDMDFILTVQRESRFDNESKWDKNYPNKWDYAFGYCQYNTAWQPLWLEEYKNLKTWQEQLNHCHEKYTYASTLKGGVGSRFHGYIGRKVNKDQFVIQ